MISSASFIGMVVDVDRQPPSVAHFLGQRVDELERGGS